MTTEQTFIGKPQAQSGLKVCVFCSANDLENKYVKPAQRLARLLAEQGHTLAYGGSDKGLMKIMASGVQAGGGKVVGISVEYLKEVAKKDADEMLIAKDLGERKTLMLERSDVLVMLVGGIGTLDEVTEIIEHKKHGHHDKPILILNTDGFYEGLELQLRRMEKEGFFWHPLDEYIKFLETPEEIINFIRKFR
jgi:uncharacterized protein (TIGR00730 family)